MFFDDWQLNILDKRQVLLILLVYKLILPYSCIQQYFTLKLDISTLKNVLKHLDVLFENAVL